jgi:hypothetical protein
MDYVVWGAADVVLVESKALLLPVLDLSPEQPERPASRIATPAIATVNPSVCKLWSAKPAVHKSSMSRLQGTLLRMPGSSAPAE